MKVADVKDYLVDVYETDSARIVAGIDSGRNSVLLLGSPGIGKSFSVNESPKQIAHNLGREFVFYDDSRAEEILANPQKYFVFVEFNLNDCEPSDLSGIPRESGEGIKYLPFLWALCLSRVPGMLFLDEITNVQRLDVITASYKIVLDRRCGFTQFHDGVMVVAAGNYPEESSVANLLPNPFIDRFTLCHIDSPTVDEWFVWMDKKYSDFWDIRTFAYLKYFVDDFLRIPRETESLNNFPTPRSWTDLSLLLKGLRARWWDETSIGILGAEVGDRFRAFINTDVPDIEQLIRNPSGFSALGMEQKYLASVFVGSFLKERLADPALGNGREHDSEVAKAMPLLEVMGETQRDFVVLSVISCGEYRYRVVHNLTRRNKEMSRLFTEISSLREQLEV